MSDNGSIQARVRARCNPALLAGIGVALAINLSACAQPQPTDAEVALKQRINTICDRTMGLDVTGPYFPQCRDYLMRHGVTPVGTELIPRSEPVQHRACLGVGLTKGTEPFERCVQAMAQIDISSVHL
jgi:hypothetical protein